MSFDGPTLSNKNLAETGVQAHGSAWDAFTQGTYEGFSQQLQEAKAHPFATVTEVAGAAAVGGVMGALSDGAAGKAMLIGMGALTAVDLGSRLFQTAKSMWDVSQNPDHYQQDKAQIASSFGRGAFNYMLFGIAGGAGYKAGSMLGSSLGAEAATGNMLGASPLGGESAAGRLSVQLADLRSPVPVAGIPEQSSILAAVYKDASIMGDDQTIAIPQFRTGVAGVK
ncbi:MAG: hypothetical protein ACRD3W_00170, partial [Terriglobales bacterium]